MQARTLIIALALALGTLAGASSFVRAEERGWTVGGAQGEADYHAGVADFDDGSILSGRTDSHELGWKLFAGYRFTKLISVEAGYIELQNDFDAPTFEGVSDGTGSFFVSVPDGPVSLGYSPKGLFVEVVGSLPLSKRVYVLGKVGLLNWENETRVQDLNGTSTRRDSGTDPIFGAGIEYRLPGGLAFRAEYERFTGVVDEDIDLTSAGISYRF